jgi:hypothetical protein
VKRAASHRFDFAPSRRARAFVLVSHGATVALVLALPIDLPLAASTALLVAALAARAWRGLGLGIAGLVVRCDGSVVALGRDGRAREGRLVDGSVALPSLASVAWRGAGGAGSPVESVPTDRLAPGAHRSLRVLLRYATSAEEAGAPASHARASISAALSALGWPATRWR